MSALSIIILTHNSEQKILECLESVKGLGEIIIVDGESTDKTLEMARKYKARIVKQIKGSFDTWRNQGKTAGRSEWLFYIDPDERVTPELRKEIEKITNHQSLITNHYFAYAIPRRNFVFGKELHYGGWWPDYVVRLMRRDNLITWEGELHEQPKIDGEIGYLKNSLVHLKEGNLSDMVAKTNRWSEIEAKLLFKEKHPKMTWWRFLRPVVTEVFDRLILKRGFLDGTAGIIFSIYQGWSRFATYAKLWEIQLGNPRVKVRKNK